MKKNVMMRMASCLLVAVLLTTCVISGTFAKYTSTATGSDIATVAKWSIKVIDTEIAATTDVENLYFNLFDTINDTNNTADETNVSDNLIAPGTAGSFEFKVKNDSEVNAKYSVTLTETNASNIPLQYSVDGTEWKDSIAELSMTDLTDNEINIGVEETVTVYWRWVFEGTTNGAHAGQIDATDTALGIAGQGTAPTVTIKLSITVTQID